MNCVFCKIAAGEIPSDTVAEGEDFLAFRDLQPQAATHVLVIPRRHIGGIADIAPEDGDLVGRLMVAATDLARGEGLANGRAFAYPRTRRPADAVAAGVAGAPLPGLSTQVVDVWYDLH